jgi:hypothetical protein
LQSSRTAGEIEESSSPSSWSLWAFIKSEIELASESASLMMEYEMATVESPLQYAGIVITLEKAAEKVIKLETLR